MSQVICERQDGLALVTLNRPEKQNALSPEMIVRLRLIVRLRPPNFVGR